MQLTQKIDASLRGLPRIEHLESDACQPAGNIDVAEHVVGHDSAAAAPKFARIPIGSAASVSTGEPKATMLATSFVRR